MEAHRAQCWILLQARLNDPSVAVDLPHYLWSQALLHHLIVQVAVHLSCRDPLLDRPPADPQLLGQGCLAPSLFQVLSQQHALLPSAQASLLSWRKCESGAAALRASQEVSGSISQIPKCAIFARRQYPAPNIPPSSGGRMIPHSGRHPPRRGRRVRLACFRKRRRRSEVKCGSEPQLVRGFADLIAMARCLESELGARVQLPARAGAHRAGPGIAEREQRPRTRDAPS